MKTFHAERSETRPVVLRRRPAPVLQGAFRAILVQAGLSETATKRMSMAAHIADILGARLIGLGCASDPYNLVEVAQRWSSFRAYSETSIEAELDCLHAAFETCSQSVRAGVGWRAERTDATTAFLRAAHAADLIVHEARKAPIDEPFGPDLKTVLRKAGAPMVLFQSERPFRPERIVVAWKDGPTCRRALGFSMPFLQHAEQVVIVSVQGDDPTDQEGARVREVAAGLRLRGVPAEPRELTRSPRWRHRQEAEFAVAIDTLARENEAGLVVAGAFGSPSVSPRLRGSRTQRLINQVSVPLLLAG